MKKYTITVFLILCSLQVNAATINFSTRAITHGVDSSDYRRSWHNQSSSITTRGLDSFTDIRSGRDTFSHLGISFFTAGSGGWDFQAGLDAHYGAAFYINGNLITSRSDDLWWARSWDSGDILNINGHVLSAGNHMLDIYWAEKCCDGPSSVRFRANDEVWQSLSADTLDQRAAVPEPWTIVLIAVGLLLLAYQNNRVKYDKVSSMIAK